MDAGGTLIDIPVICETIGFEPSPMFSLQPGDIKHIVRDAIIDTIEQCDDLGHYWDLQYKKAFSDAAKLLKHHSIRSASSLLDENPQIQEAVDDSLGQLGVDASEALEMGRTGWESLYKTLCQDEIARSLYRAVENCSLEFHDEQPAVEAIQALQNVHTRIADIKTSPQPCAEEGTPANVVTFNRKLQPFLAMYDVSQDPSDDDCQCSCHSVTPKGLQA